MKITDISIHAQKLNNKTISRQVNYNNDNNIAKFDYGFYQYPPTQHVNFEGRVQCDFLKPDQIALINNFIINHFGDITSDDLKKQTLNLTKKNS